MLVLAPVAGLPEGLLPALGAELGAVLGGEVSLRSASLNPRPAFDRSRRQYNSTHLLELLRSSGSMPDGGRVLGVIDADLFVPVLTFVFGEAEFAGSAAVISLTRLRPSFYGLPEDGGLLFERTVKEALHEIGHTFGLHHCRETACVMRASTNADEVDLKPARFCPLCAEKLRVR